MSRSEPIYYVSLVEKGKKQNTRIDLTNRVTQFTFDDEEKKTDQLKLTVDNWDLANFDSPVWKKGNILEVTWGYIGNMAPARRVEIKKVTGSTQLTVVAHSLDYLLSTVSRTGTYENRTRSQIVEAIAIRNGYSDPLARMIEDTEDVLEIVSQPGISDAVFLRRLARREGFEFFIDFDGFHFHKRKTDQKPLRELQWFGGERGDVESFSIENDVTNRPAVIRASVRDPLKKKESRVSASAFGVEKPMTPSPEIDALEEARKEVAWEKSEKEWTELGRGLWKSEVVRTITKHTLAILITSETTEEKARKRAKALMRAKRQHTIKMKMSIVGDPQLLAKSVVLVTGIGERLSGNYYVKKVTHSLGTGYTCSLEMIRDGISRSTAALFRASGTGGGRVGKGCLGGIAVVRSIAAQVSAAVRRIPPITPELENYKVLARAHDITIGRKLAALKSDPLSPKALDVIMRSATTIHSEGQSKKIYEQLAHNPELVKLSRQLYMAASHAEDECILYMQSKKNTSENNVVSVIEGWWTKKSDRGGGPVSREPGPPKWMPPTPR